MRSFCRACVAFLLSLSLFPLSLVSPAAAAAQTLKVQAGGATQDQSVQALLFFPGSITVDVGDSIAWTDGSAEPHTISFGKPPFPPGSDQMLAPAGGTSYDGSAFTSSGLLLPIPGTSYTLTFSKEGTYQYACLLHPASMHGTVVVQAAGTAYPAAQASYAAASDPAFKAALTNGTAADETQQVASSKGSNGTTTYAQNAGIGDAKSYGIYRFGATDLTIHAGDTVVWTQRDPNNIHTVSFLNAGQDVPFVLPNGTTNPQAAAPAGGKTYAGTGYFNSGIMLPTQSYSLTFSKAGVYPYVCLLHDDIGMKATITVLAATGATAQVPAAPAQVPATAKAPATTTKVPTALPHTGAGGESAMPWLALLVLGVLGIGIGVGQIVRQRG